MPTELSDEKLLETFLAGRSAALGELARRYERPLLGLATGLLGGRRELACDAVQETWLRVIRFGGSFDRRSALKTWLYRITVNQCHSLLRARAPVNAGTDLDLLSAAPVARAAGAAAEDELAPLRKAVERLPEAQRAVVLLCYHAGLTHPEAAEILDIPLGTLKSRLHAALTELRKELSPEVTP